MKEYKVFLAAAMMLLMTVSAAVTVGAANVGSETSPSLKLSVATYSPIPAEPGKPVDVWVNVRNIGGSDAQDIQLEFVDSSAFTLVSEQDRVAEIPAITVGSDYTVKYALKVSDSVADGSNELDFKYTIGNLPGIISTAGVFIDVKSAETPIAITDVRITPSPLAPGGKTVLSMNVRNLARSSNLRNVDVALQLTPIISGTTVVDIPFVTVNSGNEKSIDRILPGESAGLSFDLAAYPGAAAAIYKLPILVSYYDDTGRQYNKTVLVGVEVNSKPDMLVNLESSDLNKKVKSGNILFNVVNRGTTGIKLATITLVPSGDYVILSPSPEIYLGKIDSDDFQTAKYTVETVKTGNVTFKVKLTYMDSLNQEYIEARDVVLTLNDPEKAGSPASFIWLLVLVVLIVGGIVWYRRRRRKNK